MQDRRPEAEGQPSSYIVRIYRMPDGELGRGMLGIVEDIGIGKKLSFRTYDELREILEGNPKQS